MQEEVELRTMPFSKPLGAVLAGYPWYHNMPHHIQHVTNPYCIQISALSTIYTMTVRHPPGTTRILNQHNPLQIRVLRQVQVLSLGHKNDA